MARGPPFGSAPVCLSNLFLTLIRRSAHTHCESPSGQLTFPFRYYEYGYLTCILYFEFEFDVDGLVRRRL